MRYNNLAELGDSDFKLKTDRSYFARELEQFVKDSFTNGFEMLVEAKQRLDSPDAFAELAEYIENAFKISDESIIVQIKDRLSAINDKLIDLFHDHISNDFNKLIFFARNKYSNVPLSNILAFVAAGDPKKQFVINLEQIPIDSATKTQFANEQNLIDTLVHEGSHSAAYSADYYYISPTSAGQLPNVRTSIKQFEKELAKHNFMSCANLDLTRTTFGLKPTEDVTVGTTKK